jgi:hypothetical protein
MGFDASLKTGASVPTAAESPGGQGGGVGTIKKITSDDGTVAITAPTGPTTDLSVASIGASWTAARRTFLISPAGSPTNPGFSDGPGPWNPATLAKATVAQFAGILPVIGNSKIFDVVVDTAIDITTVDAVLSKVHGYASWSLRGTATNATASAVAFAGGAADTLFQGWVTAPGAHAAGYNPDNPESPNDTLVLTEVGGGTPAFAAEPATPLMFRFRFSSSTATVGLRNAIFPIVEVEGVQTIRIPSVITRSVTDVGYIEAPGLTSSTDLTFDGNTNARCILSGIATSGGHSINCNNALGNFQVCGLHATGNLTVSNAPTDFRTTAELAPGGVLTTVTVGPNRAELNGIFERGGTMAANSYLAVKNTQLTMIPEPAFLDNNVSGDTMICQLQTTSTGLPGTFAGTGFGIGGVTAPARFLGASGGDAIDIISSRMHIGKIKFGGNTNIGCNFNGPGNDIAIIGAVTGVTNDVNLNTEPATRSTIVFLGDGLNSSGTSTTFVDAVCALANGIGGITYAQAFQGFLDQNQNMWSAPDFLGGSIRKPPYQWSMKFSGQLQSSNSAAAGCILADTGLAAGVISPGGIVTPFNRYPVSQRLISRLRVVVTFGNLNNPVAVVLYINGVSGAALVVTIPAHTAIGTMIEDTAHPIVVAEGSQIDLVCIDGGADNGTILGITAMLEGP